MNTLKEILTKLQEKEAESKIIPEEVDYKTRAGVEAIVRNAKTDIDALSRSYKEQVMSNVVLVAVKGKTAKEFAEAASKSGAVAVDFNLIVDRLVSNLASRAVGATFTSNANFMLLDEMQKVRLEYDMVQLPTPQINAYNDGIYDAPLAEAIKKLILKNYGSGFQSAITRREIGKAALAARFGGKKLPVIVYNLDQDVDTRFIPAPTATLTSNAAVSANIVKKKLAEIRAQLNKDQNMSQEDGQQAQEEGR